MVIAYTNVDLFIYGIETGNQIRYHVGKSHLFSYGFWTIEARIRRDVILSQQKRICEWEKNKAKSDKLGILPSLSYHSMYIQWHSW